MNWLKQIKQTTAKIPGRTLLPPLAVLAVFLLGWYVGLPAKSVDGAAGGDDTVWTCSMHPQIRQPNSGLCPICAMDLIPLAPGGEGGLRELTVTPEAAALMDLRVSEVVREPAAVHVELFGRIAYDERKVNTTTARIGGRLDRFFIDYTGTEVQKGFHIAEIYSPELFVAQKDLIKAVEALGAAREDGSANAILTQERLVKSARERLRLLEITPEQIDEIAARDKPEDHVTLYAPQDGVVTARHVLEGAYVKEGDPLFSVASLDSVWLNLEAYEADVAWLNFAQEVSFTVEAIPGRVFSGRIAYIDSEIDARRRIVKVRVNVSNEERLLKPGMFARATVDARVSADGSVIDAGLAGKWISPMHPEVVRDQPGECPICGMDLVPSEELGFIKTGDGKVHENPLLVPAQAVLQTGKRATVYVRLSADPVPTFEGREIVLGSRVGDRYIVRSGLSAGEYVVTRGAFKLDSELQIRAKPSMMNRYAGLTETPASQAEASLVGQWEPVLRALGRFGGAADGGRAQLAHESLAEMGAAIDGVRTDAFQPNALQAWREFSVRLKNAIEQAHQRPASELELSYRDVRHAVEEAGRYLGLPSSPVIGDEALSDEAVENLKRALEVYYVLADALAKDDFPKAAAARQDLLPLVGDLGIETEGIAAASDMATLRASFEAVSNALIDQISKGALDRVGSAYVNHCPMAFDFRGADWISPSPEILNPYFGAEMLSCGTVKRNLSFELGSGDSAPAKEEHDHHKH